jgi:hypothetical protein
MRQRIAAVCLCALALGACKGTEAAAPKNVEIVSANDHRQVEFLNTKLLEELKNPIFGGVSVKGTAEWQRAAAGYASSLKLAAQAVDTKGFTFNVTVNVDGGVSDKVVEDSKLATDAAKEFVNQLARQMAAAANQAAGYASKK